MNTEIETGTIVSKLEKLGFKRAAEDLKMFAERKRKLALAYEHYRYVRQEKIDAFNEKLKAETITGKEPYTAKWKTLDFVSIGGYGSVPPDEVLTKLETAQERKCFDTFEVAYIRDVKDPILFGRITGCRDRFFIGQWDTDVKIEDILLPNEG